LFDDVWRKPIQHGNFYIVSVKDPPFIKRNSIRAKIDPREKGTSLDCSTTSDNDPDKLKTIYDPNREEISTNRHLANLWSKKTPKSYYRGTKTMQRIRNWPPGPALGKQGLKLDFH
jgi:hypothetical protein